MARPVKNNCDYFPHDSNMRNHRKVKAVRNKCQNGYAIWVMIIEYLTGSDGNEFENSDIELELMSGDFGFPVSEIKGVVEYCISLEMLFEKNGFIYSESLNERLAPVYSKRGKAKDFSKKQHRKNGKFCSENTNTNGVSVTEKPQSKVKEIKEEESKVKESISTTPIVPSADDFVFKIISTHKFPNWRNDCIALFKDEEFKKRTARAKKISIGELEIIMKNFFIDQDLLGGQKNYVALKTHFLRTVNKMGREGDLPGHPKETKAFSEIPDQSEYENMEEWEHN